MSELIRVAVDAMGGDNAPGEVIKGTVEALNASREIEVFLVGDQAAIEPILSKYEYDKARLTIVHASEVISNNEPPAIAIKKKKDSSIVVAQRMVKEGKADAFVSAGCTGAVLVGGHLIVGRIKGIERPALAPLIPTLNGFSLLIDCGANVDAKPSNLVQFARMGSIYMENIMGRKNPKVAIVNIGAEEEKGNALVKATYPLLKECKDINFVGNVEARDIPNGDVDVVVCEAFVGNVILKMYEGVANALIGKIKETMMASMKTKIGALLIKDELKKTLKAFDTSDYGGAPMLGLKGLVVKTHGSSKSKEIKQSILQCIAFKQQDIPGKIAAAITVKDEPASEEA
ncbi:MAG: phosphate acyltransferase PlsX [Coprococcus sp.]